MSLRRMIILVIAVYLLAAVGIVILTISESGHYR